MTYVLGGVVVVLLFTCAYLTYQIGVSDPRRRREGSRLSNDARAIALAKRDKENK